MKNKPKKAAALIRNVVEVPWQEFPGHFGGALSKALVRPETAGSRLIDYRISCYQPMAYVELHTHKVQEQVYHVLDGEGMMEMDGRRQVVRKHDFIDNFQQPGASLHVQGYCTVNGNRADLVFRHCHPSSL